MFAEIPSVSGGILSSQLAKIKALTRDPNRTFCKPIIHLALALFSTDVLINRFRYFE
jgi:hypothetical protein